MRTLDRYLIRQTLPAFLLALAILTFLLSVLPLMAAVQQLLTKGVPLAIVGKLMVLLIPSALGLTIPMALLIGLLMSLGRMSADSEIIALLACGVSLRRLFAPILLMAVVLCGLTAYVMIELLPASNQKYRQIYFSLAEQTTAQEIKARQFFTAFTGKVLLIQDIDTAGLWHKVMLADTRQADRPVVTLAERGRMIVRRADQVIDLELDDLTRYQPDQKDPLVYTISPSKSTTFALDAKTLFDRAAPPPDLPSSTIAELQAQAAIKVLNGESPHPEIMTIQQKFSFPVACLVMALLGLGLGVHTRREGKFAGFSLGLAVILVYYALMEIAEHLAQVNLFPALWARWVPNIALGAAGVALLWWQSLGAERSISVGFISTWWNRRQAALGGRGSRVVLVVRMPYLDLPKPRLLDRYVSGRYLRSIGLSFVGLMALFYISTFVDLSAKVFGKNGSYALLFSYLWYQTPQFVYWVLPLAVLVAVLVTLGALTKSSELTVMRACGVSLYRIAAPILLLSLVWAGGLFLLEETVLPGANVQARRLEDTLRGRAPLATLDDRHWLVGGDDRLYYYQAIDTHRGVIRDLSLFTFAADGFHLASHTYAERVAWRGGADWVAETGWVQSFSKRADSRRQALQDQPMTLEPIASFVAEKVDPDVLSYTDLKKEVTRRASSGFTVAEMAVQLQGKLAFPFVAAVMTLIAIPFGMTHGRRGALYGIGVGIALALTYRLAIVFFAALGSAGLLPPALAAWAPNLLFVAGALVMLLTVRT